MLNSHDRLLFLQQTVLHLSPKIISSSVTKQLSYLPSKFGRRSWFFLSLLLPVYMNVMVSNKKALATLDTVHK